MAEQSDDTTTEQTNASTEDNTIYDQVDIMPYFPGGPGKMMSFRIDKTLVYPKAAQEYGIHGIVVVDFVVNKDGSLSDVQAKGSVDSLCFKALSSIYLQVGNFSLVKIGRAHV